VELADMLEEEYRRSCGVTPPVAASPFSSERGHLRRNIKIALPGKWAKVVRVVVGLLLATALFGGFGYGYFAKTPSRDNTFVLAGLVIMFVSLGYVLLTLIYMAALAWYRRRVLKRLNAHLSTAPELGSIIPPVTAITKNQHEPRRDESVSPVPKLNEAASFQEQRDSNT